MVYIFLVVNFPVRKVTVPFVHVWKISYITLNEILYLYADLFLIIT